MAGDVSVHNNARQCDNAGVPRPPAGPPAPRRRADPAGGRARSGPWTGEELLVSSTRWSGGPAGVGGEGAVLPTRGRLLQVTTVDRSHFVARLPTGDWHNAFRFIIGNQYLLQ